MKKVIISPYAAKLQSGSRNPKNYPYWPELIALLKNKEYYCIQIGSKGEEKISGMNELRVGLSFKDIEDIVKPIDTTVISVDSFLPHLCYNIGKYNKVYVIWGMSDPSIFGYSEHTHLLKNRSYLRDNQFYIWNTVPYNEDAFLKPEDIIHKII